MNSPGPVPVVAGAVRVRVPLRRPLVTSRGTWDACDAWLLRVLDADGRAGWGEATLGPGADPADQERLDGLVRAMIGAAGVRRDDADDDLPPPEAALAAAIEGAALDLGLVLGERPRAPRIPVNAMIGAETPAGSVAAARSAVSQGFRTLKLKGGGERSSGELGERVAAVRDAVGPRIALRLDVNGAWTPEVARARIAAVAPIGLQYVEQPLPAARPGDPTERDRVATSMAGLRRACGVPLAADESVTSPAAARALLAAGAVDVLVVKPGRVGGPRVALAIADLAADAGVSVVISTLLETGIGLTTAVQIAAMLPGAVPGPLLAQGLATGSLLADTLVRGIADVVEGEVGVPVRPGIQPDRAAIGSFAIERLGAWS